MTSEQIRLALTIAETGSISGAAKRLYLTQPTVSGTLAALEREVGCTLFKRSNRGAVPTAEGAEFLRSARRIAQELDGIAQLNRQGEVCRLHLTSFSSTRVERAFTQFCLNHQYLRRLDISYEIRSCSFEQAAALAYDGESDLVIIAAMSDISPSQRQFLSSRQLTHESIGRMPVAVTMAQSHPLCQGELTLERAAQFTRLESPHPQSSNAIYPESIRPQLQSAPSIQIQSRAMRIRLAAAGIGFFFGMPLPAEELAQKGLVCRIVPETAMHIIAILPASGEAQPQRAELLSLVRHEYECDSFFQPADEEGKAER